MQRYKNKSPSIYLAPVMVMRLMLLLGVQYDGQPVDDGHHHSPITALAPLPRFHSIVMRLLIFISCWWRSPRISWSCAVTFSQQQSHDLGFDALMILVVFRLSSFPLRVAPGTLVIRRFLVIVMVRVLVRRVLVAHRRGCLGRRQALDSVGCVYLVAANTGHFVHCSFIRNGRFFGASFDSLMTVMGLMRFCAIGIVWTLSRCGNFPRN